MIDYRPCGVCRALVPATGCEHWRPRDVKIGTKMIKRDMDAKRARDRAYAQAARDRAKRDVEAFRRMMTMGQA